MNIPIHNSNNWNVDEPSLASLFSPLRVELAETDEGWCVEISSLAPCDAMMALTREDSLEESTILSGSGSKDGKSQWVARIYGPIEVCEAEEIVHDISNSIAPLSTHFNMQSIVTSKDGESVSAHVRDYDDALTLIATAISQYGSAMIGESIASPDLGLVDSILHRTGTISIRPIETEVFSSFMDVGISTIGPVTPADSTLIYDIFSDSWHGD